MHRQTKVNGQQRSNNDPCAHADERANATSANANQQEDERRCHAHSASPASRTIRSWSFASASESKTAPTDPRTTTMAAIINNGTASCPSSEPSTTAMMGTTRVNVES